MADESGVIVTIKDIYEGQLQLIGEVRSLVTEFRQSKATDDDHEKRIRVIEKWVYGIPAAVLIAAGGVVTAIFK